MPQSFTIETLYFEGEGKRALGISYFKGEEESLPDYINYKDCFLVSVPLKNVINMYTAKVHFKPVILINIELMIQKEYYLMEAPEADGLSKETTYFKNGWIDQIVLSTSKIKGLQLFKLKDVKHSPLYIYLDCVESILRRDIWGMTFEEVNVGEE